LAKIGLAESVACIEETINAYRTLAGNLKGKYHFGIDRRTLLKCKF
jgi:hypothetical protein